LPMRPTHIKGGPWLETIGTSNSHTARMTRSLTNHAPIGEYCMRFHIHGQLWCDCNAYIVQKRYHILHTCECNVWSKDRRVDDDFKDFLEFLERNPTTFAFPSAEPPPPFPKARKKKKRGLPDKQPPSNPRGICDLNNDQDSPGPSLEQVTHEHVWVPSRHKYVLETVAQAKGWAYEDIFFR